MFLWPVPGYYDISDGYFAPRPYGVHGLHLAVDVPAPSGAPIVAIGAGRIIFANWAGSAGRSVYLDMGAYRVHYCHVSAFNVTVGQAVAAGDVIGWVGGSGHGRDDYYKPHLHLNLFARARPGTGPSHWVEWVGMWAVAPELYLDQEDDDMATKAEVEELLNGGFHNLMFGDNMLLDKMVQVRDDGNRYMNEQAERRHKELLAAIRGLLDAIRRRD